MVQLRSDPHKPPKFFWVKLKTGGKKLIGKSPRLGFVISYTWKFSKFLYKNIKWEFTKLTGVLKGYYGIKFDIDKIYWIDPEMIELCSQIEFSVRDFKGKVIGGDWDQTEKSFDELDIFIALKQVCVDGQKFSSTYFYKQVLDELNNGEIMWGCTNVDEFNGRCDGLIRLFQDIQRDGYKLQSELVNIQHGSLFDIEDEIGICIGRNGKMLFSDGAHRLSIAKLLNIPELPVKVSVRHPEWIKFRNDLISKAKKHRDKFILPFSHPDLDDIPHFPETTNEGFIKNK